jgi:hypothetical protein
MKKSEHQMKTNNLPHIVVLSLLGCSLAACSHKRELSSAEQAEIDNAISNGIAKAFVEMDKKMEEIQAKNVTFLVDGERDETHKREIFSKLQRLEDDEGRTNNNVWTGYGYMNQTDACIGVGPISDMQAAAAKIDFAQVLAVDEKARVILLDASAQPAARPPDGWPGADAIKAYAIRKTISYAPMQVVEETVKELGRDHVVVVWMPEQKGLSPDDHPIVKQLRSIAPKTLCHVWGYGPKNSGFVCATIAPAPNFGEIVKAVQGLPIIATDEKLRVILIGDVNDLLPQTIEERMAAIQKSKSETKAGNSK